MMRNGIRNGLIGSVIGVGLLGVGGVGGYFLRGDSSSYTQLSERAPDILITDDLLPYEARIYFDDTPEGTGLRDSIQDPKFNTRLGARIRDALGDAQNNEIAPLLDLVFMDYLASKIDLVDKIQTDPIKAQMLIEALRQKYLYNNDRDIDFSELDFSKPLKERRQ